jgi:hypothetical protein
VLADPRIVPVLPEEDDPRLEVPRLGNGRLPQRGEPVLDPAEPLEESLLVPAGTNHDIKNTGRASLKLYTLYAPPNHRDGVVHHARGDAEADDEHFDGKTTE